MAAKLEKTKTPGVFKRGARHAVIYRDASGAAAAARPGAGQRLTTLAGRARVTAMRTYVRLGTEAVETGS
jgi:hypothetical protein